MIRQPAPWTVTATPASVLDHHVLGYCYDTNPPELKFIKPSIDLGAVPEGVRSIAGISSSDLSSSIPVSQPLNKSKMVSREAVLQGDDTRHPKPRFSLSPEDKASGEQVLSKDDTRRLRPRYGLSPEDKASNEHK